MRNVSDKSYRKSKQAFLFNNPPPPKKKNYEVMWKNIVELGRQQMTVWCLHIACWLPKATNTLLECVIFMAIPPQHWLHECASMLNYTYIACLVYFLEKFSSN
jgi:hypothetical protein